MSSGMSGACKIPSIKNYIWNNGGNVRIFDPKSNLHNNVSNPDHGVLIYLPCDICTPLYHFETVYEKVGRKKVEREIVAQVMIDHVTIGCSGIPIFTVCNNNTNVWADYSAEDFGKIIFISKTTAEEAARQEKQESSR